MAKPVDSLINSHHTKKIVLAKKYSRKALSFLDGKTIVFTMLCVFLALLAVWLGFWQLSRAAYHQTVIDAAVAYASAEDVINPDISTVNVYQPMAVDGIWRDKTIFIDSQVYQGQIGYHVLQLFELNNKQTIWVDRGFIAIDNREEVPRITRPSDMRLHGEFFYSQSWANARSYIESLAKDYWRVSSYADAAFTSLGEVGTVRGVLRLNRLQQAQLQANWPRISVNPDKNRGYAVQWFAIAFALVLAISIFLWHNNC